jgi:4a-hydroxytetrahydrobiopterin dehydratase
MDIRKLTEVEIDSRVSTLPGWNVEDGLLKKTFPQPDYLSAFPFAKKIGQEADLLNHHPDIIIGYKKVTVSLRTHDVGGLSDLDFELARLINLL